MNLLKHCSNFVRTQFARKWNYFAKMKHVVFLISMLQWNNKTRKHWEKSENRIKNYYLASYQLEVQASFVVVAFEVAQLQLAQLEPYLHREKEIGFKHAEYNQSTLYSYNSANHFKLTHFSSIKANEKSPKKDVFNEFNSITWNREWWKNWFQYKWTCQTYVALTDRQHHEQGLAIRLKHSTNWLECLFLQRDRYLSKNK